MTSATATKRFQFVLALFMVGLVISGLTAFPLATELDFVVRRLGIHPTYPTNGVAYWLLVVKGGLDNTYARYPWIAYGTDWLAFGHIAISLFFIGPLIRPAGSRSVLYAGIAACVLVIPVALICGAIRGIPIYWRLIDCSFGIFGMLPLLYCLRLLRSIETPNE